jgi:hypothetical protein
VIARRFSDEDDTPVATDGSAGPRNIVINIRTAANAAMPAIDPPMTINGEARFPRLPVFERAPLRKRPEVRGSVVMAGNGAAVASSASAGSSGTDCASAASWEIG